MHAPSRPSAILLAAVALLALTAGPALAKGGGVARLDAPVPVDTPPGTEVEIGWTVVAVDEAGDAHPIVGSPIYVRIVPAGGGAPVEVHGTEQPSGSGRYVATVVVPEGGIGRVEIAMRGQACDGSTCWQADYVLPIQEDPNVIQPAAGPGAHGSGAPSDQAPLAALVATVTGLAVLGALVALVLGRRAPSATRPA